MKAFHRIALFVFAALVMAASAIADTTTKSGLIIASSEMKWKPSARVAGVETADLIGSGAGASSGYYVYRVKFPPKFKMDAHSHPDERSYVVMSGTIYIGWGKKFDASLLKALPPGSYWVEPANVPHFLTTKDEAVVLHITGNGPTAVNYVDPAHAPKQK